eukprot:Pompholyxophrys_punicea_v1_NODE_459_length_1911_cov_26.718211.p2 type:complete len:118 gc:universal NODE_459_length_1911_cov_26.718211:739-386(-)
MHVVRQEHWSLAPSGITSNATKPASKIIHKSNRNFINIFSSNSVFNSSHAVSFTHSGRSRGGSGQTEISEGQKFGSDGFSIIKVIVWMIDKGGDFLLTFFVLHKSLNSHLSYSATDA